MLFSIHEEFWDRPCMGNDQTNHVPRLLIYIIAGVLNAGFRILFRMKIENQEVIDKFKENNRCGFDRAALFVS